MIFEARLSMVLDTICEDQYSDTVDLEDDTTENRISSADKVEASELIRQLRTKNELEQTPEKQLEILLKRSQNAADTAASAYRKVNDLELKVDRGFSGLNKLLLRIANGESPDEPERGSSIFDENCE